jgi:hypothetical protein
VPAALLTAGCVVCANDADAVITLLFDMPNVTLFELDQTTVPDVAVCVPAAPLIAGCVVWAKLALAVITDELLIPKLTLFEFESTNVPDVCVCVPAAPAARFVDCE